MKHLSALGMFVLMSCVFLGSAMSQASDDSPPNQDQSKQEKPDADKKPDEKTDEEEKEPDIPRGLLKNEPGAFPGYTLFSPLLGKSTYLMDMDGTIVHEWQTELVSGAMYLMDNGDLLRCARETEKVQFKGGGQGGRIQRIAWDGTVVWDYKCASEEALQHHDIEPTPDGTVLFIAWEFIDGRTALEAGRHPKYLERSKRAMWPDFVLEIDPLPPNDADVIWEWHMWDHLIQDHEEDFENYGNVSEHPELLDINADRDRVPQSEEEAEALRQLGYIAPDNAPTPDERLRDWLHINAIDYNAEYDLIALSSPEMNEIWIIDHSTTTEEAAGHEGGRYGRGGDILYRWGNPQNYGRGLIADQALYYQHDVRWIEDGYPGAGNLMIFNNGGGRVQGGNYSSVIELELPFDPEEGFAIEPGKPFEPTKPVWEYSTGDESFYSSFISGAHRLPNGNTLICEGQKGRLIEVTMEGEIVWEFVNDSTGKDGPPAGQGPTFGLFRATRIPYDHPGLEGKGLKRPQND